MEAGGSVGLRVFSAEGEGETRWEALCFFGRGRKTETRSLANLAREESFQIPNLCLSFWMISSSLCSDMLEKFVIKQNLFTVYTLNKH